MSSAWVYGSLFGSVGRFWLSMGFEAPQGIDGVVVV